MIYSKLYVCMEICLLIYFIYCILCCILYCTYSGTSSNEHFCKWNALLTAAFTKPRFFLTRIPHSLASSSYGHLFRVTRVSAHESFLFKIAKNNLLKLEVSYADIAWLFIFICQIIGKQPNSDVWVFNADVQMDGSGNVIPLEQKTFILEGKKKMTM